MLMIMKVTIVFTCIFCTVFSSTMLRTPEPIKARKSRHYQPMRPPRKPPIRGPPFLEGLLREHWSRHSHPYFTWLDTGVDRGIANRLQILFHDGDIVEMELTPHHPFGESSLSNCTFLGRLDIGVAAVTGCQDSDEVHITLLTKKGNGQYILQNNTVSEIEDPLKGADSRTSIDIPPDMDEWQLMEGDELIKPSTETKALLLHQMCEFQGNCPPIPAAHELKLRLGYDSSLAEKESNPVQWISEVLTHTQVHFLHKSLPTQLHIKVIGEPTPHLGQYWTADHSIPSVRHIAKGDDAANLLVLFCDDPNYFGTVGIAYVGGLCDVNGYQVSLNEWRKTVAATGRVVAHEMGHNFGMSHDFSPKNEGKSCTGIMDYGNSEAIWSTCAQNDFKSHYELEVASKGKHCMKVVEATTNATGTTHLQETTSSPPPDVADEASSSKVDSDGGVDLCPSPNWRGDGFCDDENNIDDCQFDGGDCCSSPKENWNFFCEVCTCHEEVIEDNSEAPEVACPSPNWKGDGYCDDENNIPDCDFDDGDCCEEKNPKWKHFCSECQCLEP